MPTNLPVRTTQQSRVADVDETFRAFFLFYFGMALIALLLTFCAWRLGTSNEHAVAGFMLRASPARLLMDENGAILLPTGP